MAAGRQTDTIMQTDTLATLFGWMAAINIALLTVATVAMIAVRGAVVRIHARLFGLDPAEVRMAIYAWLGHYKMATLLLCVVPYLALRMM